MSSKQDPEKPGDRPEGKNERYSNLSPEKRAEIERQVRAGLEKADVIAGVRKKLRGLEGAVERTEMFANFMDGKRSLLGGKIGVDTLVGLVPGMDSVTGMAGLYIVAEALNAGVPKWIIFKMLMRLGVDSAIGMIPVAGDMADFFIHANTWNAEAFREYYEEVVREEAARSKDEDAL